MDPRGVQQLKLMLEYTVMRLYIDARLPVSLWDSEHLLSMATSCRATLTAYKTKLAPLVLIDGNLAYLARHQSYPANTECAQCQRYGGGVIPCTVINCVRLYTTYQIHAAHRRALARHLWNPWLLGDLCKASDASGVTFTGEERKVSMIRRILSLVIDEDDARAVVAQQSQSSADHIVVIEKPGVPEENGRRVLDLLDSIIQMQSSVELPLRRLLARGVAELYEALEAVQTYYDTQRRCQANMDSLLHRLALPSAWGVTKHLFGPATASAVESVMAYAFKRFCTGDHSITAFSASYVSSASAGQRDAFDTLLRYFDEPAQTERLANAMREKMLSLLNNPRVVSVEQRVGQFSAAVQWVARACPTYVYTPEHRVAVVRAILRHLAVPAILESELGRTHDYAKRLFGAGHLLSRDELRLAERDLDAYIEALRKANRAGSRDRQHLLDFIVWQQQQQPPQPVRSRGSPTTTTTKTAELVRPITRPSPLDMTLDQLCSDMQGWAGRHGASEYLATEYEAAFNAHFERCMDGGGMVHATLQQLTRLVRAYAETRLERPLRLLEEHVVVFGMLLAAYLAEVEACGGLSVESIRQPCPCCAAPYSECVQLFDAIGALVPLDMATELALHQLQVLAQLPRVEAALGLAAHHHQQEEDAQSAALLIDVDLYSDDYGDDGIVLGHFDDDNESGEYDSGEL